MAQPIPSAVRQNIIEQYKKGYKISTLSRKYNVSRGSIYQLIARLNKEGLEGLKPKYANCGKNRPNSTHFIFRAVRCLRTWHPQWGAEKIHAELKQMRPNLSLPHHRTFYRWFHWNNQIEMKPKTSLPQIKLNWATRLHQCWQVDAKEEMMTADNKLQCWLNITDEYSGMVIDPSVFPL